jgi:phosphonate transport system substrate-binding protein
MLFPPTLGRARASARAQLLGEALGRQIGQRIQVRVAPTYSELEEKVLEQQVDFAWAPPSICAHAETRDQTILKAIRQGRSMYRSALVCRKSEELSIDGLDGLRASWVDPLSTGGHLLAVSLLRQRGYDPAELFRSQTYHGSYQGALLALIRGQADLSSIYVYGTEDVDLRRSLSEHVGASEVQLRGFAITDESPSDGFIDTGRSEHSRELVDLLLDDMANNARTLLLELIEADGLERAAHNDYWAVRQALVQ